SGVAYVTSDDGKLDAFDAAGISRCSGNPDTCKPLWTGVIDVASALGGLPASSPAVADGAVIVGSTNGSVRAFDAAGTTNCSGSPKVCTPLWTATTGGAIHGSPNVLNHVVYIGSEDGKLYTFDATGTTNCSGSPKVCTPLWTATTGGMIDAAPAVADG